MQLSAPDGFRRKPSCRASPNPAIRALKPSSRVTSSKAQKLADFHGIPQVVSYADYDALLAGDTIDAVYIALPNSMHADYAIRAAKAGKHVMVEKPLAVTVAESEAMIAAAKRGGRLSDDRLPPAQ